MEFILVEGRKKKKNKPGKKSKEFYYTGKHFKEMTCPDKPKGPKNRFCGCVRYEMEVNNKNLESAKKICGFIKKNK